MFRQFSKPIRPSDFAARETMPARCSRMELLPHSRASIPFDIWQNRHTR